MAQHQGDPEQGFAFLGFHALKQVAAQSSRKNCEELMRQYTGESFLALQHSLIHVTIITATFYLGIHCPMADGSELQMGISDGTKAIPNQAHEQTARLDLAASEPKSNGRSSWEYLPCI